MQDNIMVETIAPTIEAPAADTQESGGEQVVNAIDLLDDSVAQADPVEQEPPVATDAPQQDDAAIKPEKTYTQKEFDEAVRTRIGYAKRDMEQKWMQDPFYRAGKQLAEMQAAADGVTHEQALQRILNEDFERRVEAMAADPKSLARAMLGGAFNGQPAAPKPEPKENSVARTIAMDIQDCVQNGELPQDFKLDDYTAVNPEFVNDCAQYGVRAAVHTVKMLQQAQAKQNETLQKAAVNNSLPKPMRPGASAPAAQIDYTKMSSADFQKLLDRMQEEHLRGKTVKI